MDLPSTQVRNLRWHEFVTQIDRQVQGRLGQMIGGVSPLQAGLVYLDWLGHLMVSPGKQLDIGKDFLEEMQGAVMRLFMPRLPDDDPPESPIDKRFASPAWQEWPYRAYAEGFRVLEKTWSNATHGVPGLNHRHENVAAFAARQWLDVMCPANVPWLNPEVIRATQREYGANLVRGSLNWLDDAQRAMRKLPPAGVEAYKVGEQLAITPGKVVYRNDLIELIQYSPATGKVHAEPVLIVPAWILKYYILDLSPHNSLVKYLVDQGHTVFMISWKNPTAEYRDKGMEDYRLDGVMAAIETVSRIVPGRKIHGAGYCLGGTMLQIAAATMGRQKDDRLATLTLFAAQGDFTEAGELMLFINEAEVNLLDAVMAEQGFLKGAQMMSTFQLLRSNDLVWSRALKHYMLGIRDLPNELMAWNADTTRMPARMHSEYLHKLFLRNDLASGRYEVDGQPIWFSDIRVPCFAVGTVTDHVAPWRSVYKLHLLPLDGIVSEPGHPGRHFQIHHRPADESYMAPDVWQKTVPHQEGSWWPSWHNWLAAHSTGKVVPPRMGLPGHKGRMPDAPGSYVLEH